MNRKDVLHDIVARGLTTADHKHIRDLSQRVVSVFRVDDTKPEMAFTVLLNVIGYLIGVHLEDERTTYVEKIQQFLPFYVEAYRIQEKKIGE